MFSIRQTKRTLIQIFTQIINNGMLKSTNTAMLLKKMGKLSPQRRFISENLKFAKTRKSEIAAKQLSHQNVRERRMNSHKFKRSDKTL